MRITVFLTILYNPTRYQLCWDVKKNTHLSSSLFLHSNNLSCWPSFSNCIMIVGTDADALIVARVLISWNIHSDWQSPGCVLYDIFSISPISLLSFSLQTSWKISWPIQGIFIILSTGALETHHQIMKDFQETEKRDSLSV